MSTPGFVYILDNEYMPGLIKIGCTERSPRARADELSKHTGVPAAFRVLCYAEFDNFQAVEREMHEWCKAHRVNTGREFFSDCLRWAVTLLWYHPGRIAFTDATAGYRWFGDSELCKMVCQEAHENYLDDLLNPWGKAKEENERIARQKRYAEGDFGQDDEPEIDPSKVVPELTGEPAAPADEPLRLVGGTEA